MRMREYRRLKPGDRLLLSRKERDGSSYGLSPEFFGRVGTFIRFASSQYEVPSLVLDFDDGKHAGGYYVRPEMVDYIGRAKKKEFLND